jgi:hypothetical protein
MLVISDQLTSSSSDIQDTRRINKGSIIEESKSTLFIRPSKFNNSILKEKINLFKDSPRRERKKG